MNKGRILISANGNGHSAIATWWFVGVVGAVILAAVFAWMANLGGLPMGVGVIGAIFCLILSGVTHSRIIRTAVTVWENSVDGVSVTPKFPLSFMLWCSFSSLRLSVFQLQYDQISSVDVENENIIIISTANTQHKIYAMNAREIQKVIMSRKKDIADSNKSKKVDEVKITSETKRPVPSDVRSPTDAIVDELRGNLRQIAHLSLDEQLQMFNDRFGLFENHVAKMEADAMSEKEVIDGLVQSTQHYPLAQAKQLIIVRMITPWLERIAPMIEYLTILQEKFPSSSRVSSVRNRYLARRENLNSLIRAVEQYNTKNKLNDLVSTMKSTGTVLFNEELSALESVVNEYETEIKTGKISADGLVNHILNVCNTETQIMAKTQDVIAMLESKIERVNVVNLKRIKDQYPDDPQVDKLVRRAADCYLTLMKIGLLMGEGLMSPEVRSQVHSSNQDALDGMKKMVDHAIKRS